MSYPNLQWAKWAQEIDNFKNDLVLLMEKRVIWKAHNETLRQTNVTDSTVVVHQWLRANYEDSMLVGLRRILDGTKGTMSLLKFLEELKGNTSVLSYDRFRTLWGGDDLAVRASVNAYQRFSKDGRNFNPEVIKTDIHRLKTRYKKIIDYTNENVTHYVTHTAKGTANTVPTYREVHSAFDEIAEIINGYLLLLTASSMQDFEPVIPPGFELAFERMVKEESHK
jgi:hypothetical protein